jgi:hypothetical protein
MQQANRVLWALLFTVMLVGCNRMGVGYYSDDGQTLPPPAGEGLVAMPSAAIPDVPQPIGFVLVKSQSKASVANGVRTVSHVYQGRASMADAVAYYRRELNKAGWKLQNEELLAGATEMYATKQGEQVTASLSDRKGILTVRVAIWSGMSPGNSLAPPTVP